MMILDGLKAGQNSNTPDPDVLLAVDFSVNNLDQSAYARGAPLPVAGQGSPTYADGVMHLANTSGGGPGDPTDAVAWNLSEIQDHAQEAITIEVRLKCIEVPEVLGQPELVQLTRGPETLINVIALDGAGSRNGVISTRSGSPTNLGPAFPLNSMVHATMVIPAGASPTGRLYIEGVLACSQALNALTTHTDWATSLLYKHAGNPPSQVDVAWYYIRLGEKYTGNDTVSPNFTPPVNMPSVYL